MPVRPRLARDGVKVFVEGVVIFVRKAREAIDLMEEDKGIFAIQLKNQIHDCSEFLKE